MSLLPYALARPFLFGLDPETAHELTLGSLARLQHTPLRFAYCNGFVPDPIELAGLRFPNRVGLAAGLDKNARCIDALGAMGFGFVEVGTVTPKPQPGNPKPRMFRLPEAKALINRLGFNNEGLAVFIDNVKRSRFRQQGGVLGLNIGKNAATPIEQATSDYLVCLEGVYPHADYVTVNISSPNTANLRSLQGDEALDAFGRATVGPRSAGASPGPACYGLGGAEPTLTDALVVLGRIDPEQLARGAFAIHQFVETAIDMGLARRFPIQREQVSLFANLNSPEDLSAFLRLGAH